MILSNIEAIANLKLAPIEVRHQDLKYPEGHDSVHKKVCPNCNDGLLMMRRNMETLALEKHDNCYNCGRRFIYTDLEEGHIVLTYKE